MERQKIISREIEEEMKQSYVDYAMSVIVGRALPDVRDGLKPVHRRVLYAMWRAGLLHNKPFRKSAFIVGRVLSELHPHGDAAVYDTIVRMAQDFSLRYPLVDGHGNWGSIDGDSAAAMRYCITGDTMVLTDKGILPIKDVSSKEEAKINIKILSCNGKRNRASKFFNSGRHKIIEVETKLGYKIKGSYNHPLMCWTLKNNVLKNEWKLLENITEGDIVLINRGSSLFSKNNLNLNPFKPKKGKRSQDIKLPSVMNKELAFLLGSLVSEGSFHQNRVYFNNSDMAFYNKVKETIYSQFKGIMLYERKISGDCLELNIYHKKVVDFLKNLGLEEKRSDEKEIPFSVLRSSKQVVVEFLKSLFEGDGSVRYKTDKRHGGKSIELTYNSKSKLLIKQLKTILLNFGIATTKPYIDKRNNCYKLIISGYRAIKNFKDNIGFYSNRKNSILSNIDSINPSRMSRTDFIPYLSKYLRNKYKNCFLKRNNFDRYQNLEKNYAKLMNVLDSCDRRLIESLLKNKYLFDTIEKVRRLNKSEKVYSVKVQSKCHSFVANGFINHNTECKLKEIAEEILQDLEKETVDFIPNFDNSLKEPVVLPSKIPNLLINGSSGIAVGMATNIPPHNLIEVTDGAIKLIEDPTTSIEELNKIIKGPDFPTGGFICGREVIKEAYNTGRGKILVRARANVEETKNKQAIIISEIPYQINKTAILEQIANLVQGKKITGISNIRDESDREGMRVVIELKRDANSEVVLNQLYKHSRLQETFGIIMVALVDNEPKLLNLKQMLQLFVEHRQKVVRRRTDFELRKAEERDHILQGLIIALNDIDNIVKKIKASKDVEEAKNVLVKGYKLTEIQAKAILDMRLQKLASLEQEKIRQEHKDLLKLIKELREILASEKRILDIIKKELTEIKEKYGDERRTRIIKAPEEIEVEDLIKEEEDVITITHSGYIKRLPVDTYKKQRRGGRGVVGTGKKEEDFVEHLFVANTHSYILFFTDKGTVYWLKVYQIPEASRQSLGKAIINLIEIDKNEKITAFIPVKEFDDKHYLLMATKKGIIKKTNLTEYSRPRSTGIKAIELDPMDSLVNALLTDGTKQIILATKKGMAVKFNEKDARPIGRTAHGVRGTSLKVGDEIIGMQVADDSQTLLTVTENGFGKRTRISEYRLINRGGVGVINIQCTERNGDAVAVKTVSDEDEIILISQNGIIIRVAVKGIPAIGRNTQGVRMMRLEKQDKVMDAAKIARED